MDLKFSDEIEAFRLHIRARLAEMLPADMADRVAHSRQMGADSADQRNWFGLLDQAGWSVPAWPVEHGGTGWNALQRFIFESEMYLANAPEYHWIGSHMVGPVIYTFGSDFQKQTFLPKIRTGEHLWAQGFSEPGAGSDLASLRTNARREGDHYVVNGQKIWTSGSYEADYGFFIVKTDTAGKPQASISFLLVDLKTPGIVIRRIPQINGEAHLCEVFLDDVRVPAENLVGEEGKGWTYAKFLLDHERTTSSFIFWLQVEVRRAWDLARALTRNGRPLAEDPYWAARLHKAEADVRVHEWSVLRVLSEEKAFCSPTTGASVLKLRGSELQQTVTELQADLLATRALRYFETERPFPPFTPDERWPDIVPGRTSRALIMRAATIYGGTRQVQKNILAKHALGL